MFHFFRYPYGGYKPVRYVVNPVRCVEVFLCLACLVVAALIVASVHGVSVAFKIIITVVAAAFTFITIYDLISNSYKNPIYWNTWVLFAITGAIFFFLCLGVLIAAGASVLLIAAMILNAITAIIFLLDTFLILKALRKREREIWPDDDPYRIYEEKQTQIPGGGCQCVDRAVEVQEGSSLGAISTPQDHYEVDPSYSTRRGTVQDISEEHIREEIIEYPARSRSTTSYGGTFPMSKDAAPLPSPQPPPKKGSKCCVPRKKSNAARPSGSQIITKTTSGRLQRGSEGRMYLADGTPLTEVNLENGELAYRDPNDVMYTIDGIPIAPGSSTRVRSSRPNIASEGLQYRDGDWYTSDGRQVPKVHKQCDGRLRTAEGTILYEIITGTGSSVYESPEGFFYTSEGCPIGFNTPVEEIVRPRRSRSESRVQIEEPPRRMSQETTVVCKSQQNTYIQQPSGRRQSITRSSDTRPSSDTSTRSKGRCRMYLSDGTPLTETTGPNGEIIYEGPDGELYARDGTPLYSPGHQQRKPKATCSPCKKSSSKERKKSPERSPPLGPRRELVCRSEPPPQVVEREPSVNSRTVAISTRMVPKSQKSGMVQSCPASPEGKEPTARCVKSADGAPPPCSNYQPPPIVYHQYVQNPCTCGKLHYQQVSTVHGTVCGTTCPFFPPGKEPPESPKPPPTPPKSPTQQVKCLCTPQAPCGKKECPLCCGCKPKSESVLQTPLPPEPVDKAPLQTISECDYETDTPSSVWGDQATSSDVTSSPPTTSDYTHSTSTSCEKCCEIRKCEKAKGQQQQQQYSQSQQQIVRQYSQSQQQMVQQQSQPQVQVGNDEVQTSETRMIRASDVQRMNTNLPGSADNYRQ